MKAYPNPARCNASVSFADYLDVNLLRIFDTILYLKKRNEAMWPQSNCKNTKKLRNERFFIEKKANIANSLCICMVKEPF